MEMDQEMQALQPCCRNRVDWSQDSFLSGFSLDFLQQQHALALLSGDEAVALGAYDSGVKLGTGYPGTPSTEILETFETLGGKAQWAPNEKVALEVAIGVSFAGQRALVTMKHVGLNVAADPLFTVAYIRLDGALVVVSAESLENFETLGGKAQ